MIKKALTEGKRVQTAGNEQIVEKRATAQGMAEEIHRTRGEAIKSNILMAIALKYSGNVAGQFYSFLDKIPKI